MTTLNEVFTEAAKTLREKGWTQGAYGRTPSGDSLGLKAIVLGHGSCFCTMGALMYVTGEDFDTYYRALSTLEDHLHDMGHAGVIAHWNDYPERTKEEVIAALENAANNS